MRNTAAFAITRPPIHVVFTPPSRFHVCSSPYDSNPGGDAALNPPALNPRATTPYTVAAGSNRNATENWGDTLEKPSSAVTRRPGAIAGAKNVLSDACLFS